MCAWVFPNHLQVLNRIGKFLLKHCWEPVAQFCPPPFFCICSNRCACGELERAGCKEQRPAVRLGCGSVKRWLSSSHWHEKRGIQSRPWSHSSCVTKSQVLNQCYCWVTGLEENSQSKANHWGLAHSKLHWSKKRKVRYGTVNSSIPHPHSNVACHLWSSIRLCPLLESHVSNF